MSAQAQVIERDLLATLEPMRWRGRLWVALLLWIIAAAFVAWLVQLRYGLQVTDMRNFVSWGTYMTNFVFFIGISHAGTLISAILRVTNADWRRPITRMAEAITVFALLVGASMVMVDLGRPDRILNLFRYGRLQSPILWDLVSVGTYITGSFLYLYVAMIPDMPILASNARETGKSRWLIRLYEILSLGFRETPQHRRRLATALGAMAVIIIPVAVSVHTVVSWIFGMTLRPGWHSTIFGPYFVVGAIFSGTAAIITAMALFRRAYKLETYLLPDHFRRLAKLLLALSLLYAYFTLSEYLTAWYGGEEAESRLLDLLAGGGTYSTIFWLWAAFGLFLPIVLLLFPSKRSLTSIVTASVLINIGMWLKRYLIVIPTLETPFIPANYADVRPHYFPSIVEITITAGAFAAFLLLFTLFSRLFPILSIWETAEDVSEAPEVVREPAAPGRVYAPGVVVATVLLAVGVLLLPARSGAQQPAGANSTTLISLARTASGDSLITTVTSAGKPVAGAHVSVGVKRWVGSVIIADSTTGPDGKLVTDFPITLPGDTLGLLHVHASTDAVASAAAGTLDTVLTASRRAPAPQTEVPRALWSSRAPIPLIVTIVTLLSCVWGTYAFVVLQLWKLHRTEAEV